MNLDKLLAAANKQTGQKVEKDDPIVFAAVLYEQAAAAAREADKEQINKALAAIDGRLDELHGLHAETPKIAEMTVQAAAREIGRTQDALVDRAAARIAALAAGEIGRLSRTAWLWAVAGCVGASLLAFAGGALGGYIWGSEATARSVAAADAAVRTVAAREGPAAARDWSRLMMANPIEAVLRNCRGDNIATENGALGCRMWLRIRSDR
jgi:hypothetical protein